MHKKSVLPILFTLSLIAFSFMGCRDQYEGIPDVNVDVYINLQNPEYQQLAGIGSWAYVSGGSKGIIVFNLDNSNFAAYERHCTYQPENSCSRVSVEASNFYALDTCCSSRFQLIDGSPASGPAPRALKAYRTSFDGNIIHIWN